MAELHDRPFPSDLTAERALLGGLLQRPSEIPDVAAQVPAAAFYERTHERLFGLLLTMHAERAPIDLVTVTDRIARSGGGALFGGVAYVVELPEQVPSSANLPHYAGIVAQLAQLRRVIRIARDAADRAYAIPEDPGALIDDIVRQLGEVRGVETGDAAPCTLDEAFDGFLLQKETEAEEGDVSTLPVGIEGLDRARVLRKKALTILAARPSMGKTAIALNWLHALALGGARVGFASLEMSGPEIVHRICGIHAGLPMDLVEHGARMSQDDWDDLLQAKEDLRARMGDRFRLWSPTSPSIQQIRSQALRWKMQGGLDVLCVDYLDLISHDPREEHHEALSRAAVELKQLSRELGCSVLLLHAVNRSSASTKTGEPPTMAQLSGCGKLEYHADVICFPHRPGYYDDERDPEAAELIIGKNRQGRCLTVPLRWKGSVQRFETDRGDL